MADLPRRSLGNLVSQGCICLVIAVSLAETWWRSAVLSYVAGAAVAVYFLLERRRFTLASWVPVILSAALLALAIAQGTPARVIEDAPGRMVFLASLLALLGILRVVAAEPPAIAQAGRYLTGQPPVRPYLALASGRNVFGLLINLGGLAILLEKGVRALDHDPAGRDPRIREIKLRRMTVATLRAGRRVHEAPSCYGNGRGGKGRPLVRDSTACTYSCISGGSRLMIGVENWRHGAKCSSDQGRIACWSPGASTKAVGFARLRLSKWLKFPMVRQVPLTLPTSPVP